MSDGFSINKEMEKVTHCKTWTAAVLLAMVSTAGAAQIPISSYSYITAPHGNYPDSGGVELNDGVTHSLAWGLGMGIGYEHVQGLSGWLYSWPSATFYFASPQTVQQIVVWAADSDGYAGVALPSSIQVSTSGGFSQNFAISNPIGNGYTIPLTLSGFEFTSSDFTITAEPSLQWTMLSEVQAYSTPEPASAAFLALAGLAVGLRRRA